MAWYVFWMPGGRIQAAPKCRMLALRCFCLFSSRASCAKRERDWWVCAWAWVWARRPVEEEGCWVDGVADEDVFWVSGMSKVWWAVRREGHSEAS